MDPGSILAIVSLSFQVFGGCVQGFTLLSRAHNLGKDASLLQTMLNLEEYRFIQWAREVGLVNDDEADDVDGQGGGDENANANTKDSTTMTTTVLTRTDEKEPNPKTNATSTTNLNPNPRLNYALASELMAQLETLLTAEQLRKRYKLILSDQPDPKISSSDPTTSTVLSTITNNTPNTNSTSNANININTTNNDHQNPHTTRTTPQAGPVLQKLIPDTLRTRILQRANRTQSGTNLPKRLWWAAVDKKKFEEMVRDVRTLVDGLWALLDPIQREDSSWLLNQVLANVVQLSKDVGELRGVQSASGDDSSVAVAVDLKVARMEIDAPDPATYPSIGIIPKPMSAVADLPPINRTLLTDIVPSSTNPNAASGRYDTQPVWLEYKPVAQRMKGKLLSRVKGLAFLLSKPKHPSFRTLRCIGFYEDGDKFVFVYTYPDRYLYQEGPKEDSGNDTHEAEAEASTTDQHKLKASQSQPQPQPKSLNELIRETKSPKSPPSVTTRLTIALRLCSTLLTLHTAGWLHKDLRSDNIIFFCSSRFSSSSSSSSSLGAENQDSSAIDPYITGFSFSRQDSPAEISEQPSSEPQADIYRHPHALGEPSASFQKHMDLYSLGVILVELAEWKPLKHIVKKCVDVQKQKQKQNQGATTVSLNEIAGVPGYLMENKVVNGEIKYRMGDIYGQIVRVCLQHGLSSLDAAPDTVPDLLDMVRKLERCYI